MPVRRAPRRVARKSVKSRPRGRKVTARPYKMKLKTSKGARPTRLAQSRTTQSLPMTRAITQAKNIFNPFDSQPQRWPDETLTPTGLVKYSARKTWQSAAATTGPGWNPVLVQLTGFPIVQHSFVTTVDDVSTSTLPAPYSQLTNNVGTIYGPETVPNKLVDGGALAPWPVEGATDYGSTQVSVEGVVVGDKQGFATQQRTLAAGINVEVVGMPANSFVCPGKAYFLQVSNEELLDFHTNIQPNNSTAGALGVGESYCINMVLARKGFSCTMEDLRQAKGARVVLTPQGPNHFQFSDCKSVKRVFAGLIDPDNTGTNWSDDVRSQTFSSSPHLFMVMYGVNTATGLVLDFQFTHHVEYIPSSSANGIVQCVMAAPNGAARELTNSLVAAGGSRIDGSTSGVPSLAHGMSGFGNNILY